MITLITGVPGSGKTLYALNLVKSLAESEKRVVYQNGITNLTLPWEVLENAELWYECPPNSIIVIDECQRVFRPRGSGSSVPRYVSELETHRHRGLDLVLITQHPMLIDANIRRLVGRHFHVIRRHGGQRAVVHEWSSCTEISRSAIVTAIRHDFRYPKESFSWYKSAEVHTHRRRIPMRVVFLWLSPLIIAGLVFAAYRTLAPLMQSKDVPGGASAAKKGPGMIEGALAGAAAAGSRVSATISSAAYVASYAPRVPGLPHTAPAYDGVTKVIRAPVPAACVFDPGHARCTCFTQDGIKLATELMLCMRIVDGGYFENFDRGAPTHVAAPANSPGPVPRAAESGPGAGPHGTTVPSESAPVQGMGPTGSPTYKNCTGAACGPIPRAGAAGAPGPSPSPAKPS